MECVERGDGWRRNASATSAYDGHGAGALSAQQIEQLKAYYGCRHASERRGRPRREVAGRVVARSDHLTLATSRCTPCLYLVWFAYEQEASLGGGVQGEVPAHHSGDGQASARLPGEFHADPADRLIIATARHWRTPLATADQAIASYASSGHLQVIDAIL